MAALLSMTQAEAPPSPELVERFIAALPDRQRPPEEVDPAALDRLAQLNPNRETDIRPILEAQARCTAPIRRASTDRMLREVAAHLGTANVEALIRFYQGPDLARFGALAEKTNKTPEETAEFDRLLRAYPMDSFMAAMQSATATLFADEGFFTSMDACDRQRNEALARANLRSED